MKGNWGRFRQLLRRPSSSVCSVSSPSNFVRTLIKAPKMISPNITRNSVITVSTIFASSELDLSSASLSNRRALCSSSGGDSGTVLIKSDEDFKNALSKVRDGSLPAIFYFTAVWCGPCRFISPVIGELSRKYPHVTTYKIDIDEEGLLNTLRDLNIMSVPTLHFFQGGKKAAEIVGADVARLKSTMEKLYE